MKNANELKYLVEEGERLLKINVFTTPCGIDYFLNWRRRYDDWVLDEFDKECKMFKFFSSVKFGYLPGLATPGVTMIFLKKSYQNGIRKAIWLLKYYNDKHYMTKRIERI